MFKVEFDDEIYGHIAEEFDTFDEAIEFWNAYADEESCKGGTLWDTSNGEAIFEF